MQLTIEEKDLIENYRKLTATDRGHVRWVSKLLASVTGKIRQEGT